MDDDFFAVSNPPADEPPVAPAEGENTIFLGAPPPAAAPAEPEFMIPAEADSSPAFLGDVNEADSNAFAAPADPFGAPSTGDPFGAPSDGANNFATPPADGNEFAAAPRDFADAPAPAIILGAPAPVEVEEADDEPVDEPPELTPMAKWNYEWQETLKERKDQENSLKAEMLETARLELENFQAEREKKKEARIAKNREDEQAKLEAIEADLENDNSWQRLVKMVELSHDSTDKAQDVKRMRDVMIYLKNDEARATVLGA